MASLIPIENGKASNLWFDRLGIKGLFKRNALGGTMIQNIALDIIPTKINANIDLKALRVGLLKLLDNDQVFNNEKEIIILTDGRNLGISKTVGCVVNQLKRPNIKLIGLNSLQNIFEEEELTLEVLSN